MKKIIFSILLGIGLLGSPLVQHAAIISKHQNKEVTVYITRTGTKYHASGCQYLRRSQIAIGKDKAIAKGFTACSKCNP